MKTLALLAALLFAQGNTPVPSRNGTVAGQVRAIDGSPAAGIRVSALSVEEPNADDAAASMLASLAQTDSAGRYRLEDVPPGRYYILVGPIAFPTYFPGVKAAQDASVVTVSAGAAIAGMDFRMTRPEAVRVSGRVIGLPAGLPAGLLVVGLGIIPDPGLTVPVGSDGAFEFPRLPPGNYRANLFFVRGHQVIAGGTMGSAAIPIAVDDVNISGIEIAAGRSVQLGRVLVEEGGPLPVSPDPNAKESQPPTLVSVAMRALGNSTLFSPNFVPIPVQADGWFALSLARESPGNSQFLVSQLPFGYHVKSITCETSGTASVDLLQRPFFASCPLIEVKLTTRPPRPAPSVVHVRGRFTGYPGTGTSGTLLMQLRGVLPDVGSALGIADQVHIGETLLGPDGSFEFANVPPGSYDLRIDPIPQAMTVLRRLVVPKRDVAGIVFGLTDEELDLLSDKIRQLVLPRGSIEIPGPRAAASPAGESPNVAPSVLVVSQSGRGFGGAYFLVSAAGAVVEEKQLDGGSVSFALPAGNYELHSYIRTCAFNCGNGYLNPPTAMCRTSFSLAAGQELFADRVQELIADKVVLNGACTLKFSTLPPQRENLLERVAAPDVLHFESATGSVFACGKREHWESGSSKQSLSQMFSLLPAAQRECRQRQ